MQLCALTALLWAGWCHQRTLLFLLRISPPLFSNLSVRACSRGAADPAFHFGYLRDPDVTAAPLTFTEYQAPAILRIGKKRGGEIPRDVEGHAEAAKRRAQELRVLASKVIPPGDEGPKVVEPASAARGADALATGPLGRVPPVPPPPGTRQDESLDGENVESKANVGQGGAGEAGVGQV